MKCSSICLHWMWDSDAPQIFSDLLVASYLSTKCHILLGCEDQDATQVFRPNPLSLNIYYCMMPDIRPSWTGSRQSIKMRGTFVNKSVKLYHYHTIDVRFQCQCQIFHALYVRLTAGSWKGWPHRRPPWCLCLIPMCVFTIDLQLTSEIRVRICMLWWWPEWDPQASQTYYRL